MTRSRLTTWTLTLVFGITGVAFAQQPREPLTPVSVALGLRTRLDKDSYRYENATQAIASSYWRGGNYESAFSEIERLQPTKQSEQLYGFTVAAIRASNLELAKEALNRALKLVVSADEESRDSYYAGDFAVLAIEAGDLEVATKFAAALDEGSARKIKMLLSISQAFSMKGPKEEAIGLVDQALKESDRFDSEEQPELINVLGSAGRILVDMGERDRAAKLASQANELLSAQAQPRDPDSSSVALSFARLGDFSRATALIESLDDVAKANTLLSLASVYQERGDETGALTSLIRAREIVNSTLDGDYSLSMGLYRIAQSYAAVGKPDEAFEVLGGIRDPYYLSKGATELADSFIAKGRRQDGSGALDFGYSQIRQIVSEKSEDIPGYASFSKAKEKSQALLLLGDKYLVIRDVRGAEAAANAIDQPQYKALLLAKVATAYAEAGDQSKAKSILATALRLSSKSKPYNHDAPREVAMLKVAEGYADIGLKQEAANAVLRCLIDLRDSDYSDDRIAYLFEIGLLAETRRIPLNRSTLTVLRQVINQAEDN